MYLKIYIFLVDCAFFCSKFWARNRPGDAMTDKYNLDIQGIPEDGEYSMFVFAQTFKCCFWPELHFLRCLTFHIVPR
jgi:hypothetical protein